MSTKELLAHIAELLAEIETERDATRRSYPPKYYPKSSSTASHLFHPERLDPTLPRCSSETSTMHGPISRWLLPRYGLPSSSVIRGQSSAELAPPCAALSSISLHKRLNANASAVFEKYAAQLQHLTLYQAGPPSPLSMSFPRLQSLTPMGDHHSVEWLFADVVRLFGLARTFALPLVTLPTLRCLEFSALRTGSDVLTHLSLPALETLHIASLQQAPFTDLLLFLQRCAPPLRELVLRGARSTFPFPRLNECLRLLPSLTHLEVWAPFADLDTELFTALADSESLLPNLRTLRFAIRDSFTFTSLENNPNLTLSLAGFQRLIAEGMEVVIGEQKLDRELMKLVTTHYISS
ncbi:hypothetical protein C8R45DRAFT_1107568 [Mycena sanguinolenta]|nr:hypothetical protein C8R45DRAFT_1107568 [Mycena sanguinolenta]